MGCGKSSVGRRLSEPLCCPFMDLDSVIEEYAGKSIPEIFTANGEAAFRAMEQKVLEALTGGGKMPLTYDRVNAAESEMVVLALGGGTVMTPECAELVQNNTRCIYLKASVETLVEHLDNETDKRPLLSGGDLRTRIEDLMSRRSATYERTAYMIIDTDGKTVDEIASAISYAWSTKH